MRSSFEHVCHSWIVSSNCRPGSAHCQAASGDLLPEVARLDAFDDVAGRARRQQPVVVAVERVEEAVGQAHGVVGVLAGDRDVGFGIPGRIVLLDLQARIALARVVERVLRRARRDAGIDRVANCVAQRCIERGIEPCLIGNARVVRGRDDRVELLLEDARANDEIGDLALLAHLPIDELFDVGVIGVEDDHLRSPPRRAARFDRAGRTIEDLEERHQSARGAAAGQFFSGSAKLREICAAAGAALKDARLAHDAVEDAAFINEIVLDSKDVTSRHLGMGKRIG